MTDTYTWRITTASDGAGEFAVRSIPYGDGYFQKVSLGINAELIKWTVVSVGYKPVIDEILNFMRTNKGKAFYWKPPLADIGFYKLVGQCRLTNVGGMFYTVTMDFVQVFGIEHEPVEI